MLPPSPCLGYLGPCLMGWKATMGGKAAGIGGEKHKCPPSSAAAARSRMKLWMVRATTTVLLWTCVVQLTAVGETWGPRVLKGWPSCLTASEEAAALAAVRPEPIVEKPALPPKREWVWSSPSLSFTLFRTVLCLDAVPRTLTAGQHFVRSFQCRFPQIGWKMTVGWCAYWSHLAALGSVPNLRNLAWVVRISLCENVVCVVLCGTLFHLFCILISKFISSLCWMLVNAVYKTGQCGIFFRLVGQEFSLFWPFVVCA